MHEAVPRPNEPAQALRRTDHVTRSRPPNRHKLREQLLALTHLYPGLIAGRKEGKHVFYRLADARVAAFIHTMHRLFCQTGTTNPQPRD